MSTLNIDDTLTAPPPHSSPVGSVSDVARLINSHTEKNSYARWIVFLALGACFSTLTISPRSPMVLTM